MSCCNSKVMFYHVFPSWYVILNSHSNDDAFLNANWAFLPASVIKILKQNFFDWPIFTLFARGGADPPPPPSPLIFLKLEGRGGSLFDLQNDTCMLNCDPLKVRQYWTSIILKSWDPRIEFSLCFLHVWGQLQVKSINNSQLAAPGVAIATPWVI